MITTTDVTSQSLKSVNVTLHGKKEFAHMTKLRIVRYEDHSGLSEWAQCNNKGSHERDLGVVRVRQSVMSKHKQERERDLKIL